MTVSNIIGIIGFVIIFTVGTITKTRTGNKVKGLDGLDGVIQKKDENNKGSIVGKL